mmetsp:Transcript_5221/g.14964  ORF Transcript_5221/g.14964 Transcript_5221/m.14964 type:complete len:289 (-) Transcript_5221:587-1453(-)
MNPGCLRRSPVKYSSMSTSVRTVPEAMVLSSHDKNLARATPSRTWASTCPASSWSFLTPFAWYTGEGLLRILPLPPGDAPFSPLLFFALAIIPNPSSAATLSAKLTLPGSIQNAPPFRAMSLVAWNASSYGRTVTPASLKCFCTAGSLTLSTSTNSSAVVCVSSTYEQNTGLYDTSEPRRFSSHATSSSIVTASALAWFSSISARILPIFALGVSPAHVMSWMRTGSFGAAGLPDHASSTGLLPASTGTNSMSCSPRCFLRASAASMVCNVGSMPTLLPAESVVASQS